MALQPLLPGHFCNGTKGKVTVIKLYFLAWTKLHCQILGIFFEPLEKGVQKTVAILKTAATVLLAHPRELDSVVKTINQGESYQPSDKHIQGVVEATASDSVKAAKMYT